MCVSVYALTQSLTAKTVDMLSHFVQKYFLSLSVMLLEIKDPLTGIYNAML